MPSPSNFPGRLSYLRQLEAESIQVIREVAAELTNPVMLYSAGKDSQAMLHLAIKAFHPAPVPFPLLHIDTTWKFHDLYRFRDAFVRNNGLELLVHRNERALAEGMNPFDFSAGTYTRAMKTEPLLDALRQHGFDAAFGGARRDEEKSRAKERVYSLRDAAGRWKPESQRPELWNLCNGQLQEGDTLRVFPLSSWSELDVWFYILLEEIPVVPLYFAADRPVVVRSEALIVVDDDRMRLRSGERPTTRRVRFRSIGCYPLTGATESSATTMDEVVEEAASFRLSERQGRLIDHDADGSMELKKREGYF